MWFGFVRYGDQNGKMQPWKHDLRCEQEAEKRAKVQIAGAVSQMRPMAHCFFMEQGI